MSVHNSKTGQIGVAAGILIVVVLSVGILSFAGERGKFKYPGSDVPVIIGETTGEPVQKVFSGL